MRKVFELYQKLEDNDFRNKNDDKKRLDTMYKILYESIIQLNVSEFTDHRALALDEAKIREYQDKNMGSRIGQEIVKAGYTETKEWDDNRGRERRLSVLVLK